MALKDQGAESREVSALRDTVSLGGQETPLHLDKLPCPAPLEKSGTSNQQLIVNMVCIHKTNKNTFRIYIL